MFSSLFKARFCWIINTIILSSCAWIANMFGQEGAHIKQNPQSVHQDLGFFFLPWHMHSGGQSKLLKVLWSHDTSCGWRGQVNWAAGRHPQQHACLQLSRTIWARQMSGNSCMVIFFYSNFASVLVLLFFSLVNLAHLNKMNLFLRRSRQWNWLWV